MSGGTIKNCYAKTTYLGSNGWMVPSGTGGGVYVGYRSTFNMTGGTIDNCEASCSGGGVMVQSSIYNLWYGPRNYGYIDSSFTMSDGTIKNCKTKYMGGGIAVFGTYDEAYPIATSYRTPAVIENTGIHMSGGTIEGCSVKGGTDNGSDDPANGGGIGLLWIRSSIPTDIHNVTIKDNTATVGGGISVLSYWTQADIKNCTITGNTSETTGGGIDQMQNSSGGKTKVTDCTITGNKSSDYGGGIHYDEQSKLEISGKNTITGNTYNGDKNNLHVLGHDYPVYVTGDLSGSKIGISDEVLWEDDKTDEDESAESDTYLTSGYNDNNSSIPYEVFKSDHKTWYAYYSDVKEDEVRLIRTKYVLHYNDNKTEDKTDYYNPESPEDLPTPKRKGYVFKGWYKKKDFSGDSYTKTPSEYEGSPIDYFAKWELEKYKITYNLDGGKANNPTEYIMESDDIKLTNPKKKGYTFKGWTGTDLEEITMEVTIPKGSTGDRKYTAHWEANVNRVSFSMNGHGTQIKPQFVTTGDKTKKPAKPKAKGYTFVGWFSDPECKIPFDFEKEITEDTVIYAKWKKDKTSKTDTGDYTPILFMSLLFVLSSGFILICKRI